MLTSAVNVKINKEGENIQYYIEHMYNTKTILQCKHIVKMLKIINASLEHHMGSNPK